MTEGRFDQWALLPPPTRVGSATGIPYNGLRGLRLIAVESGNDMGVVTDVLRSQVELDGRGTYLHFRAIDAGFYDAEPVDSD